MGCRGLQHGHQEALSVYHRPERCCCHHLPIRQPRSSKLPGNPSRAGGTSSHIPCPSCVTAEGFEAATVCSIGHYGCLGAAMGFYDSTSLDLCLVYAVPLGVIQSSGQPQLLPLYATGATLGRCLLCRYTQRCPQLQVLSRCFPLYQQLPRLQALLLHRLLALLLPLSPALRQPQQQTTAPQLRPQQRLSLPQPMTQMTRTRARRHHLPCPRQRPPQTSWRTPPWTALLLRLGRQLAPQLPLRQRLRPTMTQKAWMVRCLSHRHGDHAPHRVLLAVLT